ncbi:ABC transporter transmembrane domain-containing protein [Mucilaginibacter celer]|uniref:ABC transporter ATP-binding protein n=1 Tax=Mucilaginibacter celer TaxID=2305508 RepID=A0A494W2R0_9SPHI|nr:ABC transporter transmembrane domain-containing protein [Mucilaginibacter celer]AYL97562.1 ABC transporter ATP-binding protein [Mucilaginibacter celer]
MRNHHQTILLTPWQKLVRILHHERSTINYIYIYAILIGLIGLTLPLGTTAVFNLLSNGALYSSTYILIAAILIGILVGGLFLITQLSLVEVVEQRIFAKMAMEFAYRLPLIKKQALEGENPQELVNRFFDILTIQKGLTKLLVDIIAAAVQIFFSAILLSFYHPFFIGFGMLVTIAIIVIIALYFKRGVNTSIEESEYKYEVVAYLENVASNLDAYRDNEKKRMEVLAKTDEITANYLQARNDHFGVLKRFFTSAIMIRTLLMGGLLLLGSYFVVDRQMSFGQFVAAEVIVVQITYAIEKLMTNMNTVFDMVTGSEKLSVVTDLAMEEREVQHG